MYRLPILALLALVGCSTAIGDHEVELRREVGASCDGLAGSVRFDEAPGLPAEGEASNEDIRVRWVRDGEPVEQRGLEDGFWAEPRSGVFVDGATAEFLYACDDDRDLETEFVFRTVDESGAVVDEGRVDVRVFAAP